MAAEQQPTPERKDIAEAMAWSVAELIGGIALRQDKLGTLQNAPKRQAEIQHEINVLDFELQMKQAEAYHAEHQGDKAS